MDTASTILEPQLKFANTSTLAELSLCFISLKEKRLGVVVT